MKKIILSLAIASSLPLSAQIDFSRTRFGAIVGGNYSRVSNVHSPSGPRYTFQAGAVALIPIGNDDQFYIQPELVYYGAGETGKDKDFKGRPGYDAVYANNYISVPIYFKGYFSEAESEFFGLIGPRFNFLINEKVKNEHLSIYNPDKDPEAKANRFNFAMGAGLGYSYKRQLEFNVRYDFGFSNTYPKLKDYASGDPNAKKNKSEQVLSVGISYIFE